MNDLEDLPLKDVQIRGKKGDVFAYSMQRHYPTDNMHLITTVYGSSLFVQGNHPLWVLRKRNLLEEEAKNISPIGDSIWVDETICYNTNSLDFNVDDYFERVIVGNPLDPDFINRDVKKLKELITRLVDYKKAYKIRFEYEDTILPNQLKLICNRIHCKSSINYLNGFFFVEIDNLTYRSPITVPKYTTVISNLVIENYNKYIYDIKTETKEFMMNCTQNHNSFHLGGAVIMQRADAIKEIMSTLDNKEEPVIRSILRQEDNIIYSNLDGVIIKIDKNLYQDHNKLILQEDGYIQMPVGHFTLMSDLSTYSIQIEAETYLYKQESYVEEEHYIIITYNKNDPILYIKPFIQDFSKLAQNIDSLIAGKSPWSSVEGLYYKFFRALKETGDWDSTHLEVIISEILRDRENPHIAARLAVKWDPEMHSIKKLPSLISWPLGVALENFTQSVSYGLVEDRAPSTPIEKILFGESLLNDQDTIKYTPTKRKG